MGNPMLFECSQLNGENWKMEATTTESYPSRRTSKTPTNDNREIWLMLTILVLILFVLVFVGLILHFAFPKIKEDTLCLSKDCTLTASELISAMDPSIKPCEDFYEFSCADFIRKNPVPKHKKTVEIHSHYKLFYMLQLRDMIENEFYSKEPKVINKVQETYHVCINSGIQNNQDLNALQEFLKLKLGGWPQIDNKDSSELTLENISSNLELDDIGMQLARIQMIHNPENASRYAIGLYPVSISSLSKSMLQKYTDDDDNSSDNNDDVDDEEEDDEDSDEEIELKRKEEIEIAKQNLIFKVSSLFGVTDGISLVIQDITTLEEEIQSLLEKDANRKYQIITIKMLNDMFLQNEINWLNIINSKFWNVKTFIEDDQIIIHNWNYFEKLPHILKKYSKRTFVNYIGWKVIFKLIRTAGPKLEDLYRKYKQKIDENYAMPVRWIYCLQWLQKIYPLALTRMFVNRYIDKNGKTVADEMIKLIQEAFKNAIKRSNWLDDKTKEKAMLKAEKLERFIGYPNFIFTNDLLDKEYTHIPHVHNIHFRNYVNMNRDSSRKKLSKFEKPVNVNVWKNPLMINAYYLQQSNSIWFPSGILQLPFFDDNRLVAVNFGMIGAAIGHEIGHAFDDSGSKFNEKGVMENWWTEITREIFNNKTNCFISQYSGYCPDYLQVGKKSKKICVDGRKTAGENMADNMGLQAAYDGYQLWKLKHGKEKQLPGLEQYNPDQIFFLSYGHLWCENVPPDEWERAYRFKKHSSGKYRVLGTLSNSKDFAEAFGCSVGTMNRGEERCEIW